MRGTIGTCVALLALTYFLPAQPALAQTRNPPQQAQNNQERLLQELLDEVRQLRATLQRVESNTFRAQVTLDRLRVQQEQVLRLTREVADIREKLVELKSRQQILSLRIPELEKQIAAGVKPKTELDAATQELEELKQREQNLVERETQFSADLQAARVSLLDLNGRLDALERDIRSAAPARRQ